MLQFLNRVKMDTSTTGTGTITLGSAVSTFQTVTSAGGVTGDTYRYLIENDTDWEIGYGVYTSASQAFTRVLEQSSTGSLLNLPASGTTWAIIQSKLDAGALVLIQTQTPTGTGVVTFLNIPQYYTNLLITGAGRSTAGSSPGVNVAMTFNSDTGSNYDIMQWQLANATGGTNSQAAQASVTSAGFIPWSAATTGNVGSFRIEVINYSQTTLFKGGLTQAASIGATTIGASNIARSGGFLWRSATAISRVDLTLSAGNWDSGSQISLYGVL